MMFSPRIAALAFAAAISSTAIAADPAWMNSVGEALGKTGSSMPGGIYRVGLPRSDRKVTLDGVEIKPALALGSWLAFRKNGNQGRVMGDLVLLPSEVNAVMTKLEENGIEVTALHNHLLRNEPFTMYMHIRGHGDPAKLATVLHAALAESKTPLESAPAYPAPAASSIDLDTATIDKALGHKGPVNGGVYQFNIQLKLLHHVRGHDPDGGLVPLALRIRRSYVRADGCLLTVNGVGLSAGRASSRGAIRNGLGIGLRVTPNRKVV